MKRKTQQKEKKDKRQKRRNIYIYIYIHGSNWEKSIVEILFESVRWEHRNDTQERSTNTEESRREREKKRSQFNEF